jgi:chemotaxis signal transduction protein
MERKPIEYAAFSLSGALFGVDVALVREVVRADIRLNATVDAVCGDIRIRSLAIPVIDLRRLFSMEKRKAEAPGQVIIAAIDNRMIGLAVDEFLDVCEAVPAGALKPAPDDAFSKYVSAGVDSNCGPLSIVDLSAVSALLKQGAR